MGTYMPKNRAAYSRYYNALPFLMVAPPSLPYGGPPFVLMVVPPLFLMVVAPSSSLWWSPRRGSENKQGGWPSDPGSPLPLES